MGFVDGPNLYAYVRNNPWTLWDPLGLAPPSLNEMKAANGDTGILNLPSSRDDASVVGSPLYFQQSNVQTRAQAEDQRNFQEWLDSPTGQRIQGGFQVLGGLVTSALGIVGVGVPEPATTAAGGALLWLGTDNMSVGSYRMIYGKPAETATTQIVTGVSESMGASETQAVYVDSFVQTGLEIGSGSFVVASQLKVLNRILFGLPVRAVAGSRGFYISEVDMVQLQALAYKHKIEIRITGSRAETPTSYMNRFNHPQSLPPWRERKVVSDYIEGNPGAGDLDLAFGQHLTPELKRELQQVFNVRKVDVYPALDGAPIIVITPEGQVYRIPADWE